MRKSINQDAIEIQRRFFMALEQAINQGNIAGLKTFCDNHNLCRVKYSVIRKSLANNEQALYKIIDLDALSGICRDFGVSPRWLLLGYGNMYVE